MTSNPGTQQIIYALERQEAFLREQANKMLNALDYGAQFPDEDADRMREAIDALQANHGPWRRPGPVNALHPLECLVVVEALRQSDGDWWLEEGGRFMPQDAPLGWLPNTESTRAAIQGKTDPGGVQALMQLRAGSKSRVYIAGPMTGIPEFNFPLFNATAARLRAAGWHVENPAEHGVVEGATWEDYLRYDIGRLATCSAIYLLPGWQKSKGASLEVHIARTLGLSIIDTEAEGATA